MRTIVALVGVVLSLMVQADVRVDRTDRADPESRSRPDPGGRADAELVQLYLSLSELPLEEQRQQTWALSSKTKAALWKHNIERYLQVHPELGMEERNILLEGMRLITSPGWFDIEQGSFGYAAKTQALAEHKQRVETLLQPEVIYEVFLRLGPRPDTEDPLPPALGGSRMLTPRVNIDQCSCGSYYECWYYGTGFTCGSAACQIVMHCGWYGNEPCTGKCKYLP
jgi:hypothetical protein